MNLLAERALSMARIGKDKIRMNGLKVYGWQLALLLYMSKQRLALDRPMIS